MNPTRCESMLNFIETQRSRRTLLQMAGLGALGFSLPRKLGAADSRIEAADDPTFGRAKRYLFLYLSGGPSQYETFDPKPGAPAEIRGQFQPISTSVPGTQICELLPRIAQIADKFSIVRSLTTQDPNHESAGYWVNTGHKYTGPDMRALAPTDWPTVGSIVKRLKPSGTVPFTTVQLPEPIIANPGVFLPGQNAGYLGREWDPEIFRCDPTAPDFQIDGFNLPGDVGVPRMSSRRDLLGSLEKQIRRLERTSESANYERQTREAFDVLLSGAVKQAFRLDEEPASVRDRYGRGKWAQSVLLARRLLEAGVRMVFVNWPREPGDMSVGNPLWDTHAHNNARMKDVLCPQFDQGFPALLDDLKQRGLLSETLVVAVGEMGRTPKFNGAGGRDHWGDVFPFAIAGAGIRPGIVYGSSDPTGAFPVAGLVNPSNLAATVFHLLGIGHDAFFPDRAGRPTRVTEAQPIWELLG